MLPTLRGQMFFRAEERLKDSGVEGLEDLIWEGEMECARGGEESMGICK